MSINKKVVFLPYDFDTALGINNEGALTFGYGLEDVDTIEGANVFNGQESVLWNNLRDAFGDEIKAMYQSLRSAGTMSYATVEQRFEDHQSKWPEAIFNEDARFKYIDPLTESGNATYLYMLLGSKTEQRKWWLYNRFRYMDSKYNAGDALSDIITIRGYAKSDITVTPYADIYPSIKYGSYLVQTRGVRNTAYTLACPLTTLNDTEIYIYSASQLKDIGDVSGLMPGFCDFSNAVRLQALKIGDSSGSYSNGNLTELNVGNLPLLKNIDVRNCPNLTQTVDLSGCTSLEKAYFSGTSITGVSLANGAAVDTLVLPNTITNLTLRNLTKLSTLTVAGYSNVSTLWLEGNSNVVNTKSIFDSIASGARVRILGIQWSISSNTASFIERLEGMRGIDESGNNTTYAQLSGTIYFSTISGTQLATLREHYPNVTFSYGTLQYSVDMYSEDGTTLLKSNSVTAGQNCPSYTPAKDSTAQYTYTFSGWATSVGGSVDSSALNNIQADKKLYAVFTSTLRTYTVKFYNESTLLQTVNNVPYGGTATYTGSEPTKEGYEFSGWSPSNTNITGATSCYAQFELATLDVTEITDSWATIIANCANGTATTLYNVGQYKSLDLGTEGTIRMQIVAKNKDVLADNTGNAPLTWVAMETLTTAKRWNPAIAYDTKMAPSWTASENVWTSQNRNAVSTAKATWTLTASEAGTISIAYKTSNANTGRNTITKLTVNGTDVVTNYANTTGSSTSVEVASGDTVTVYCEYDLKSASYSYYATITFSGAAFTTYSSIQEAATRDDTKPQNGTGTIGGWENCELREYLRTTIYNAMPSDVKNGIKTVTKKQQSYNTSGTVAAQTTSETVWLPSYHEMGYGNLTGETASDVKYSTVFRDNASRVKNKYNTSTAQYWWLRSAYGSIYACNVSTNGNYASSGTNPNYAVVPSFCT